jgi:predicted MarR family transcription regulator
MFHLLDAVINEEQLLDFALSHICEKDSDEVHQVADAILTCYIVNDFNKQKKSFTEDDILDKINEHMADYVLTKLSKQGLVDVSFENSEIKYVITEEGRKKING